MCLIRYLGNFVSLSVVGRLCLDPILSSPQPLFSPFTIHWRNVPLGLRLYEMLLYCYVYSGKYLYWWARLPGFQELSDTCWDKMSWLCKIGISCYLFIFCRYPLIYQAFEFFSQFFHGCQWLLQTQAHNKPNENDAFLLLSAQLFWEIFQASIINCLTTIYEVNENSTHFMLFKMCTF